MTGEPDKISESKAKRDTVPPTGQAERGYPLYREVPMLPPAYGPLTMYEYHGSDEHQKRLREGRCRCGSNGPSYDLAEFVVDGVIRDPRGGDQPLTSGMIGRQDKTNVFNFAVSRERRIRIAPDGDRKLPDAVKHETLFHNEPVLAAGEVYVENGLIAAVNDLSGSYRTFSYLETDPRFARELLRAIILHGIPATPVVLDRLASFGGE